LFRLKPVVNNQRGFVRSEPPVVVVNRTVVAVVVVNIASRRHLPSRIPPLANDIGRQWAGGGADETFGSAITVAAALDEVTISSIFGVVPPTASVVVVVVILPSSWSLALGLRLGPRPPPPARTPIPDRETRPRGATKTTTTARRRRSTRAGHRCRRIEDDPRRSPLLSAPRPPPPTPADRDPDEGDAATPEGGELRLVPFKEGLEPVPNLVTHLGGTPSCRRHRRRRHRCRSQHDSRLNVVLARHQPITRIPPPRRPDPVP
jgi:hypothetical protein